MKLFKPKTNIQILKNINVNSKANCLDAKLIHITGLNTLKTVRYENENSKYGEQDIQVELNNTPIFYAHTPCCPTCASIIATGHGIETSNCEQLKNFSDSLNANFVDLATAIHNMTPLLTLLESGLYVIADQLCFPSDGANNFFWNTQNNYTENHATGPVFLNDEDFDYTYCEGYPCFLYPTQSSDLLNENRVQYYHNKFKDNNKDNPRVIALHYNHFLSLVLDGHHKACAASLLHKPVNTICIIPLTSFYTTYENQKPQTTQYAFANFHISETDIPVSMRIKKQFKTLNETKKGDEKHQVNHHNWDLKYTHTSSYYPTLKDVSIINEAYQNDISDNSILKLLHLNTLESKKQLRSILLFKKYFDQHKIKTLALACAQLNGYSVLKEEAFKVLVLIKDDIDIEQFFINYLCEDIDTKSKLYKIACTYWD